MSRANFTKGIGVCEKDEVKSSRDGGEHLQRPNSESKEGFRDLFLEALHTCILMI